MSKIKVLNAQPQTPGMEYPIYNVTFAITTDDGESEITQFTMVINSRESTTSIKRRVKEAAKGIQEKLKTVEKDFKALQNGLDSMDVT